MTNDNQNLSQKYYALGTLYRAGHCYCKTTKQLEPPSLHTENRTGLRYRDSKQTPTALCTQFRFQYAQVIQPTPNTRSTRSDRPTHRHTQDMRHTPQCIHTPAATRTHRAITHLPDNVVSSSSRTCNDHTWTEAILFSTVFCRACRRDRSDTRAAAQRGGSSMCHRRDN